MEFVRFISKDFGTFIGFLVVLWIIFSGLEGIVKEWRKKINDL